MVLNNEEIKLSNRKTNLIAALLLLFMAGLAFFSILNDSLTMDEVAHLPSGYSYLTQKDMRLNPEHPPLIKDLAALPLLFVDNINFPSEIDAWKTKVNGQWDFGFYFLYQAGNPADQMIFWGRIPMILVLLILGFYVFKWARELFGNCAGLLALFFFSFSPAFIAHGRLVTTDVAAAAGAFIATYYFIKALRIPKARNIILAGIFFGIAELLKFSLILLLPLYVFLAGVWWLIKAGPLFPTLKILFLVFFIGFLLIWPVYQYHVSNYPTERQASNTEVYLAAYPKELQSAVVWMTDKPVLRAYAQYLTGLLMVFNRVTGGNTTYFLGEVSNQGWKNYFPVVYAIKVPLAFHILTLIALLYAAWLIKKPFWQNPFGRLSGWLRAHFAEFAMLSFVAIYWAASLVGTLNIGIRHLLPTFPFLMLPVAGITCLWLKPPLLRLKTAFLLFLILWQAVTVVAIFPHFLAYFNELAGGPDKGYIYTVDSNLDWGQDLKRLKTWADQEGIDKIYVSYFGGSDPQYYLGTKYAPWWGERSPNELPKGSYLAVSATLLQGGRGEPAPGFDQPTGQYKWLDNYKPITRIGYSIFVYYID